MSCFVIKSGVEVVPACSERCRVFLGGSKLLKRQEVLKFALRVLNCNNAVFAHVSMSVCQSNSGMFCEVFSDTLALRDDTWLVRASCTPEFRLGWLEVTVLMSV